MSALFWISLIGSQLLGNWVSNGSIVSKSGAGSDEGKTGGRIMSGRDSDDRRSEGAEVNPGSGDDGMTARLERRADGCVKSTVVACDREVCGGSGVSWRTERCVMSTVVACEDLTGKNRCGDELGV
jgi:hypothetical protein